MASWHFNNEGLKLIFLEDEFRMVEGRKRNKKQLKAKLLPKLVDNDTMTEEEAAAVTDIFGLDINNRYVVKLQLSG